MLKKIVFSLVLMFISSFLSAQEETVTEVSESEITKADVPYAVIENVPVYPGCDGNGNQETVHVHQNFRICEPSFQYEES